MADQFLGEIRIVGFNFAPAGWAVCNGLLMAIQQNTALFSLLGTYYGGDGRSTFALPNLQGNAAIGQGNGPGLSQRFIGEIGGQATTTLLLTELAAHNHALSAAIKAGTSESPEGLVYASSIQGTATQNLYGSGSLAIGYSHATLPTGGGQPHNNMQPVLAMNFVIALTGIFPSRA